MHITSNGVSIAGISKKSFVSKSKFNEYVVFLDSDETPVYIHNDVVAAISLYNKNLETALKQQVQPPIRKPLNQDNKNLENHTDDYGLPIMTNIDTSKWML